MPWWGWLLTGFGAWLVVGLVAACAVDEDTRDAVLRILVAPATVPVLLFMGGFGWAQRLPKFTRRRVTADSLRLALDDDHYEQRTTAINWPGGALVLLRSKRREADR